MSKSTWTNEQKLAGQTSITYDNSSSTYDQANLNYEGQITTKWTNDPLN